MKIKKLSYIIHCAILAVFAYPPAQASTSHDPLTCNDQACYEGEELLFRVRTDQPVPNSTTELTHRQDNQQPIGLPHNGMIWATEDTDTRKLTLSVSAPAYIALDRQQLIETVRFSVRSNYSAFVERYELSIYRGTDIDQVEALITLPVDVDAISTFSWDGKLPASYTYRTGDTLIYVMRAYGQNGTFDETHPKTIQLVTPEQAKRGISDIQDRISKRLGTLVSTDEALTQSLIDDVTVANDLYKQNIPVYGSRVRIQGNNIPKGTLSINGESYPVDLEGKFVTDFMLPLGQHDFDITVEDREDNLSINQTLAVDVSGNSLFTTAIADMTLYQQKVTGTGSYLADEDSDKDLLADGRLAFYLKSQYEGRYTFTAQADTTERRLEDLFSGFGRADAKDLFLSLDPNMYYPTYGDDSSVYRDIDTQGKFYARLDWDKNQALWGNYNTGITGTEYGRYTRSLYGAAVDWRSLENNQWGDPNIEVRAFGSNPQSAAGHSEFLGTGGSLYYLKHTDILPGSDKVQLEIKNNLTGRTESLVSLTRGVDYEIDAIQGRIILTRPLSQIVKENVPSITHDMPLSGYQQVLVADYEWEPALFDDSLTAGVRSKYWLDDYIAVGGTYVQEGQTQQDYTLKGVDLTLKAGKGTYLKTEYTRTESMGVSRYYSDNGGFSFTRLNPITGPREGVAKAVEARANLKEQGLLTQDISLSGWWRHIDAGYSTSSYDTAQEAKEYGTEISGLFFDDQLNVYGRHTYAEQGVNQYIQTQLTSQWRTEDNSTLTGELRRIQTATARQEADGTLGAVRYSQLLTSALELYGAGQLTLDNGNGNYSNNDAVTAGSKYYYGDMSSVGAEYTTGARGKATEVSAEHQINSNHSIYSNYTFAQTSSDYDSVFNADQTQGLTVGQRWRLTDKLNMFNESQALKGKSESGSSNTLGMDYLIDDGWSTGFTLQDGQLTNSSGGKIDRTAISGNISRTTRMVDWKSKLEWRQDTGAEHRRQWVTTNRLSVKLNEDWRVSTRFNFADTHDYLSNQNGARYIESGVGFAWRPAESNRWAAFGRYTYLYDLASSGQETRRDYDQRTQIVSLEGIYKYDSNWEFASKVAQREGDVRFGRDSGQWYNSRATFVAGQVRYDLIQDWHVMGEYRVLNVKQGGVKQGALVGVDRDITENFRVGVGYNFTDFSDDLTKLDYKYKGAFINIVGYY